MVPAASYSASASNGCQGYHSYKSKIKPIVKLIRRNEKVLSNARRKTIFGLQKRVRVWHYVLSVFLFLSVFLKCRMTVLKH